MQTIRQNQDLRLETVFQILLTCKNGVHRESLLVGKIPFRVMQGYIQLLNRRGFIEIQYRIIRDEESCFYLTTKEGAEICTLMENIYNMIGGVD